MKKCLVGYEEKTGVRHMRPHIAGSQAGFLIGIVPNFG